MNGSAPGLIAEVRDGMMLAMLCDAVVAAKSARFSLPEINQGLPTLPGTTIVSRRFDDTLAAAVKASGELDT